MLAAAGDVGGPDEGAGAAVVGGQADEGGDLVAVEVAEFGDMGQEHGTGFGTDAGRGAQDLVFLLEVVIGLDVVLDEFIDLFDLVFEGLDHFADAFADDDVSAHGQAVGFLGEQANELSPAGDEFGERFDVGVLGRFGGRFDDLAKEGEGVGVDGVGFGEFSHAIGEVTHLAGIGDDDAVVGLGEFGGERVRSHRWLRRR